MGKCEYCGEAAGWFRSYHVGCQRRYLEQQRETQKKQESAQALMLSTAIAGVQSEDSDCHLYEQLTSIAAEANLPEACIREAIVAAFEESAKNAMADGLVTVDEERILTRYVEKHHLTQDVLDRNGTWSRIGKLVILRELSEGRVPNRVEIKGNLPFLLNNTEQLVWLFKGARLLKQRTSHGNTFWAIADEGMLAITNENLVFSGMQATVHMPLHQIVTLMPGNDGFIISKGGQKPLTFITGEGAFSTELVRGLSEIRTQELSSRSSRARFAEVEDATLLAENVWPQLPEIASQAPIAIQSDSGAKTYEVNLSRYTCTCPDWIQCRAHFSEHDVRRLCKHITREILRQGLTLDPIVRALLLIGSCPPYSSMQKYCLDGDDIYFFHTEGFEWVDVIAKPRAGSIYERFGYSIPRNGWSYGKPPRNPVQIKRLLRTWGRSFCEPKHCET